MNCNDDIFRKALEDGLKEHHCSYQYDADYIYSIASNIMPERIMTAKLIVSEPIIERIHGTKNGTPIRAIGYFKFKLPHEDNEPDFFIFAFANKPDNKTEFVIVPFTELKNRLIQRKCNTGEHQDIELQLWLLPDGFVFETTNIGAEGDWWFVGGRMAIGTQKDFTQFLNQWHVFEKCLKLNN